MASKVSLARCSLWPFFWPPTMFFALTFERKLIKSVKLLREYQVRKLVSVKALKGRELFKVGNYIRVDTRAVRVSEDPGYSPRAQKTQHLGTKW